jgi:hypothetical protein
MTDDQTQACQWTRDFFPRWASLASKCPTIGALLDRRAGDLLRQSKGCSIFADLLQEHLDLPAREWSALKKWLDKEPLSSLG